MIGRKNKSKQHYYLLSNLSDVFGQKVLWFWKPKRNVGCTVQIDQHICKIVKMKWRKPFMNRMEDFGYYGILNVIPSTLQWSKYYWYITMRIQYIYWWILLVHCIPHDHDMRVLYQYYIRDHITDAVGAEMWGVYLAHDFSSIRRTSPLFVLF